MDATKYKVPERTASGTITVYNTDVVIRVDTSSVPATVNLGSIPVEYWNTPWRLYIYDKSNNASVNNITIVAGSNSEGTAQTINGQSSLVINTNNARAIISISSDSSFAALLSNFVTSTITQAYQTVQDEGSALTQRSILNFIGNAVAATDNPGNSRTNVTINAIVDVQDEGVPEAQQPVLNFTGAGVTVVTEGAQSRNNIVIPGGVSQAYQTIQEEGSSLTQRATFNFIGSSVTAADDSGNSRTNITIQAYNTVEDEGTPVTQRATMNFVGAGVTVTDVGSKTTITIPGPSFVAPPYMYAKKTLRATTDPNFGISPVSSGVNSVFGGLQVDEYTAKTESGITFNSGTGEWTVASTGIYTVNAKFTTRIKASDINSITGASGEVWESSSEPGQLAIAILVERSVSGGSPNLIVCSNKQTISNLNISDINIECSSLMYEFVTGDVVYVVVFNKTAYTIVNLAATSGLPDCFIDFSIMKLT